jgi:dTDP-4-amino-4,6-dideoxygalactose transaminase
MTDIQGAIGVEQMKKIGILMESRWRGAQIYDELLADFDKLITPTVSEGFRHGYQSYVALLSPGNRRLPTLKDLEHLEKLRNQLTVSLQEAGIGVRQGTHAVHTLGFYRKKYGLAEKDFPNSLIADRLSIALPLFHGMTDSDFEQVASALRRNLCAA